MPPSDEDVAWFRSTFHPIPKPALPDDCVEYSIYAISSELDRTNDSEIRLRLKDALKSAGDLQKQFLKDYVWQRQNFALEIQKEDGLSILRGRTEYGDSIEDEWVVVWLLREISKKHKEVWVKITDSDGEFLLIEASGTLPSWLEPDVAENRVWINDGQLKILKPTSLAKSSKRTQERLSIQQARQVILHEPKRVMYSTSIEEEAFYRLRNYPSQIEDNMHHSLVPIPRKVAYLLRQKPAYLSPAVEAFYLRDPISLKPLQSKDNSKEMTFAPTDMITVSVKFPRVAYAQLKSQDFPPPAVFDAVMPSKLNKVMYSHSETGMKLTCGFEILLSDPQYQDRPATREIKMILEDLSTGDEVLPSLEEMEGWEKREDDERWLDISFDDLETELGGPKNKGIGSKKSQFGDKAAQENLQRIVKQFEDFMNNDKDGPDGEGIFDEGSDNALDDEDDEELDDDDDWNDTTEDKEASFDEDEFTNMMREMMGMPPEVMKEIMTENQNSTSTKENNTSKLSQARSVNHSRVEEIDDSDSGTDVEDMEEIMKEMEAELRSSGALDLDARTGPVRGANKPANKGEEKIARKEVSNSNSSDEDPDDQVDEEFVRNMLESLRSQSGMAGPGSNLLSMAGFGDVIDLRSSDKRQSSSTSIKHSKDQLAR